MERHANSGTSRNRFSGLTVASHRVDRAGLSRLGIALIISLVVVAAIGAFIVSAGIGDGGVIKTAVNNVKDAVGIDFLKKGGVNN